MLSEYLAPQLNFAGLGAEGESAADAAAKLAAALGAWTAAHEQCRIVQLSVTPAVPAGSGGGDSVRFGVMALVVFLDAGLNSADAAEAVAAAVDEIHEAQTVDAVMEPIDPTRGPSS